MGTTKMRLKAACVVCSSLLLALSACGGGAEELKAGNVRILVSASSGDQGGADVGVGGTVQLVGDCLGIGNAVAFWPKGTKVVSEDPLTIDVPGEGEISVGDTVQGAGGSHSTASGSDIDSSKPDLPIPSSCPSKSWVDFRPE
ncbi:hypothetical protein [Nocardioides mangrovi]|uniref:hypothetical protein n=1 Tax=Nocardioides mangrovi TaxID=2874580 RepID=UPI001CC6D18B|nr:hypothetical protein [Nocardioides mangrovi]